MNVIIYNFITTVSFMQVGLLDIDLCGPSVPYLLDLEAKDVHQCPEG